MMRFLLIVTAFDESHRLEAHGLVHSVHRHLPEARVLIFALGELTAIGQTMLQAACGVKVRTFDWARWAPSLHRQPYGCGWKPTVIRLALDEARAGSRSHVLWADASVRFTADAAHELSQAAAFESIAARYTTGTIMQYTHPRMVDRWEALRSMGGASLERGSTVALRKGALAVAARRERMLAATIVLWPSRGGEAEARALQRWERCCLDLDCFAPPGASGQPCPGCHRYDQSALNLALLDTGLTASAQRASGHIERGTRTERGTQGHETLQRKCPGGSTLRHQRKKRTKATLVSRLPSRLPSHLPSRLPSRRRAFTERTPVWQRLAAACGVGGTNISTAFGAPGATWPCLAFLRKAFLPDAAPTHAVPMETAGLLFHTFWSGQCNAMHALLARSFCCTQPAPARLRLWLRVAPGAAGVSNLAACRARLGLMRSGGGGGGCARRVKVVSLDDSSLKSLCGNPPLLWPECSLRALDALYSSNGGGSQLQMTLLADHVRLLLLWRYGGVWLDVDAVPLRDFAPLLDATRGRPFAYRWSNQPMLNNAVLYSPRPEHPALRALFRCWRRGGVPTFAPATLHRCCKLASRCATSLLVLPSAAFDPAWLAHDRRDAPGAELLWRGRPESLYYQRNISKWSAGFAVAATATSDAHMSLGSLWPGAFAFHMHLRASNMRKVHTRSIFAALLRSTTTCAL